MYPDIEVVKSYAKEYKRVPVKRTKMCVSFYCFNINNLCYFDKYLCYFSFIYLI